STVNISGGAIGYGFEANPDSTVNLVGTEFTLHEALVELTPGVPTLILDRDTVLTGRFVDGTSFNSSVFRISLENSFSPDATLTLTLVPEPGDYNGDGLVDATDYDVWQSSYGETVVPYSGADGNGDGTVDAADYSVWLVNQTVPEPSALVALLS
ncbi:unnamed protein product, partial [Ectocarpus sp. 4 AP-2014]